LGPHADNLSKGRRGEVRSHEEEKNTRKKKGERRGPGSRGVNLCDKGNES